MYDVWNPEVEGLDSFMETDLMIEVLADGRVTLPEEGAGLDGMPVEDYFGEDRDGEYKGWTLLKGFTGQHGYNGPLMHPSESIGGGLAKHILNTPGYYVALIAEDWDEEYEEFAPSGWVIAYHEGDK